MSELIESRIGIIPSDWTIQPLAQSTTKIQDGTHFSPKTTDGPCRYLTSKNVRWGRLDLSDCGRISQQEHHAIYVRCDVRHGDVLLTKDGANTGNACLNTLHEPFSLLSSVAILRTDESAHSASFILQYFLSPDGQRRLKDLMSGNAITRLTLQKIKAFETPVPPTPEQRKIARILTTVDNLIEKTEALIAKYKAIKQGMMHDLFTRGVDEHGHLRPPYEQAPELYKQSELGWIPKEWEARKLGEALRIAGGYLQTGPFGSQLHSYEYVTEGIPVVMPQDITGGRIFTDQIARITKSKADSMARHRLRLNDVVFSRRGDLSRAAAISPIEDGWICGTGCFLLRCSHDRLNANWIARQYAMPHVQKQVDANAVGSTMPSLNNAVMERLLMLLPSPSEQAEIGRRIVVLESVHENLRFELHKLSLTKTGLMQDLLTGKVRVKADEAEEVAVHA